LCDGTIINILDGAEESRARVIGPGMIGGCH
jgi:hypothetical protein